MPALKGIDPLTESRDEQRQIPQRPRRAEAQTFTGAEFQRALGWGKERFRAAVKSGRFDHLQSLHCSTPARIVYVKERCLAWIREAPSVGALRARDSQRKVS